MAEEKNRRMPFGKYGPERGKDPRGIHIKLIPSGYLRWVLKQDWFLKKYDPLAAEVEKELAWREQWNAHFEDELFGA